MYCPQCGRDNRAGAAFCDSCGSRLGAGQASESAFVGRGEELRRLEHALSQARGGAGRLLLVGGEPGIGKSRLAREAATRAAGLGFRVLWARCLEDPGAPPYWPWLQLLRGWLEQSDDGQLREILGDQAGLLADLLPELRQRLPDLESPARLTDPTRARFRLFEAIVRLWQRLARRQPLLLVIDNLHAADSASLRLLAFLAPELAEESMLVFTTYRDVAVSGSHPLADTISELIGLPHCDRLLLRGLSRAETDRLLRDLGGHHPPPESLAAAIHDHSEGNPLFVRELAQTLIRQGLLGTQSGSPPDTVQVPIPEGVRDVLRQRLNGLTAGCRDVLAVAAVVGRTFELELLLGLAGNQTTGEVLEALDEAMTARLIEERAQPGRYQFSHALIREVLYEELPATRRLHLHQQVGGELVRLYGEGSTAHLPRLAYHFSQAAPLGSAPHATRYAAEAGARADQLLAYEEAVRLYALALRLQTRYAASDDATHRHLLLALGTAQCRAGEYGESRATFSSAAASARRHGSAEDLAHAALGYEEASWRPGLSGTSACRVLQDAGAAVGDADPALQARLLSALTRAQIFTGDVESSAQTQQRAVALARQLDEPSILAAALCSGLSARWQPERLEERLHAAAEAIRLAEQAGDWELTFDALSWQLFDLLEAADMTAVRGTLDNYTRLAEKLGQPFYAYIGLSFRAMLALMEGQFDASEALAREALALGRRQSLDAFGVFSMQMFSIERERGRLGEVAPLLERFLAGTSGNAVWRPGLALLYTELGRLDAARAELDRLAAGDFAAVPRDGLWVTCLAYLAEVCTVLGDAARAAVLYRYLAPYAGHNIVAGTTVACYGSADRFLGLLAAACGDGEAAARHFEAALALDGATGARPWVAHTQYHYAALLLESGWDDGARAADRLREAQSAARALGMATLEQRTERLLRKIGHAAGDGANAAGLSRRELQVLSLLVAGRSNREIAARLFVSPNTVANHVRSILGKTGTSNRTEAAAFARHHNLLETSQS